MWWFASTKNSGQGGRFDLPPPNGTCYTATSRAAAIIEAFQEHFGPSSMMPVSVLVKRSVSSVTAPTGAPRMADLNDRRALGSGITAALWADQDRILTQRWAAELHGAGHLAIRHGVQHDPGGRLRAVSLFDAAGEHAPWGLPWDQPASGSADSKAVRSVLARRGVRITKRVPTMPLVEHMTD
jgi:hypothetical protein